MRGHYKMKLCLLGLLMLSQILHLQCMFTRHAEMIKTREFLQATDEYDQTKNRLLWARFTSHTMTDAEFKTAWSNMVSTYRKTWLKSL